MGKYYKDQPTPPSQEKLDIDLIIDYITKQAQQQNFIWDDLRNHYFRLASLYNYVGNLKDPDKPTVDASMQLENESTGQDNQDPLPMPSTAQVNTTNEHDSFYEELEPG